MCGRLHFCDIWSIWLPEGFVLKVSPLCTLEGKSGALAPCKFKKVLPQKEEENCMCSTK